MHRRKKIAVLLILAVALSGVGVFGWFLSFIFEGVPPRASINPLPLYLSRSQKFVIRLGDNNKGLRRVKISLNQEGRRINMLDKHFPYKGILNNKGIHTFKTEFDLDPTKLNLAQGRLDFYVRVWDYSRRNGGDGNLTVAHHKMLVDTFPPAIQVISRENDAYVGGTGLVVYRVSADTDESGVFVNDFYFPGFKVQQDADNENHVCYFAVPEQLEPYPSVYLWAKDKSGNASTVRFNCHIRKRVFRDERMNISARFIKQVLPYFSFYHFDPNSTLLQKFLRINRDLRKENGEIFQQLGKTVSPERLWSGNWLRLPNSATMAQFGDRRTYYYQGKEIDDEVHLGMDLASLADSKVPAANNGRVIFAGRLGIYGQTVVLDHGQGLASSYSHLSKIEVQVGEMVRKGTIIGETGRTGLAGGDHLHFGVMVEGVFVNPVEWGDSHWIEDHISKKLALLRN